MRYSMKRAIAFVLSLTMALALPLTASAENSLITDIYEEDDSVGRVPGVSEDYVPSSSGTETRSGTGSKSSPIDEKDKDDTGVEWNDETIEARILGVVLDQDEIEIEAGLDTPTYVQATVIFDGGQKLTEDQKKEIYTYLKWVWEPAPTTGDKWSTGQINVVRQLDENKKPTGECKLTGLNGGKGYLKVWVDNSTSGTAKRRDNIWQDDEAGITVPVTVKEYASNIIANEKAERTYYVSQKVDLNSLVDLYDQNYDPTKKDNSKIPNWNEQIGWTAKDATTAKIDAKGVATLKKAGEDVTFYGIGERGARVELKLNVQAKTAANFVKKFDATSEGAKKPSIDFADFSKDQKARKELSVKATSTKAGDITDFVTWSVKNPDVVEIVEQSDLSNDGTAKATIEAKKVGKTTVTVTSLSGKKLNFSVTVKATLKSLELEVPKTVYVGQSVELKVTRVPEQNTDKLKWSVPNKNDKKMHKRKEWCCDRKCESG